MAHCCRAAPCLQLAKAPGMRAALELLAELVVFGDAGVQDAAVSAAAAVLATDSPRHDGVPAAGLLLAVVTLLAERTSCASTASSAGAGEPAARNGAFAAAAGASGAASAATADQQAPWVEMEAWQQHALRLLRQCMDVAAEQGTLPEVAGALTSGLARAAVSAPAGSPIQARLAHSLADVVLIFPHLMGMCVGPRFGCPACPTALRSRALSELLPRPDSKIYAHMMFGRYDLRQSGLVRGNSGRCEMLRCHHLRNSFFICTFEHAQWLLSRFHASHML